MVRMILGLTGEQEYPDPFFLPAIVGTYSKWNRVYRLSPFWWASGLGLGPLWQLHIA